MSVVPNIERQNYTTEQIKISWKERKNCKTKDREIKTLQSCTNPRIKRDVEE